MTIVMDALIEQFGDEAEWEEMSDAEIEIIDSALGNFKRAIEHTVVEPVGDGLHVARADWIQLWWHVDDVRYRADGLMKESYNDEKYDHRKMHEVLHQVKQNHDPTIGVTWDSIDSALHWFGQKHTGTQTRKKMP